MPPVSIQEPVARGATTRTILLIPHSFGFLPAFFSSLSAPRVAALVVPVAGALVAVVAFWIAPRPSLEGAFVDSGGTQRVRSILGLGAGPVSMAEFPFPFVPSPMELLRPAANEVQAPLGGNLLAELEGTNPPSEPEVLLPAPPPAIEVTAEVIEGGEDVQLATFSTPAETRDLPQILRPAVPVTKDIPNGPFVTPFDSRPSVSNASQVRSELRRAYPAALLERGIGGRAELWFYVSDEGAVEQVQLHESSGYSELDAAALRAGEMFTFDPGTIGGEAAAGWVLVSVTFDGR
jgi:protein TonB